MTRYRYLHTKSGLNCVVGGQAFNFSADHKRFDEILGAVRAGLDESIVLELISREARAVEAVLRRQLSENVTFDDGVILYKGEVLHNSATTRLIDMLNRGHDIEAMVNFIEKLKLNPDQAVVDELYDFLTFGKIPLTKDGDFLVYKAVRADFKDIHSGTYLNSVGQVCSMPRERVDADRNRTCSNGLHVCSYAYLPHFSQANGHVMMCKVSPADVVAVPADYNNTKMRVARYEVVEEVTSYYKEGKDLLGEGPVLRTEQYEVKLDDGTGEDLFDEFFTLSEAKLQADELARVLREDGGEASVWVQDKAGTVLFSA